MIKTHERDLHCFLFIYTVKIRSHLFNRPINFTVTFLKMTMSVSSCCSLARDHKDLFNDLYGFLSLDNRSKLLKSWIRLSTG